MMKNCILRKTFPCNRRPQKQRWEGDLNVNLFGRISQLNVTGKLVLTMCHLYEIMNWTLV